MELFYITNSPEEAELAAFAGIDRIFIDTEILGKKERQKGFDMVSNTHTLDDILKIKRHTKAKIQIMTRINPLYENTASEIKKAIKNGTDWIMLPMFSSSIEVEKVADYIDNKCMFVPLVETASAFHELKNTIKIKDVDEIHIGLNDLSISLGMSFLFEPLKDGLIDKAADIIKVTNKKWGFGGIARVGSGLLPAEYIIAEHIRLGSSRVILSRQFRLQKGEGKETLNNEVLKLRKCIDKARSMRKEELAENHKKVSEKISEILKQGN